MGTVLKYLGPFAFVAWLGGVSASAAGPVTLVGLILALTGYATWTCFLVGIGMFVGGIVAIVGAFGLGALFLAKVAERELKSTSPTTITVESKDEPSGP